MSSQGDKRKDAGFCFHSREIGVDRRRDVLPDGFEHARREPGLRPKAPDEKLIDQVDHMPGPQQGTGRIDGGRRLPGLRRWRG